MPLSENRALDLIPNSKVKRVVEEALNDFYLNDSILLADKTNERTITHRLAEYLQRRLPGWTVDCEYNRWWKSLAPRHSKVAQIDCTCDPPRLDSEGGCVVPDIIVHHRRTDDNLLAIEVKTRWNLDPHDDCKLRAYTNASGLAYRFGLFLTLADLGVEPDLKWYPENAASDDSLC
jgi:hypothetical protein